MTEKIEKFIQLPRLKTVGKQWMLITVGKQWTTRAPGDKQQNSRKKLFGRQERGDLRIKQSHGLFKVYRNSQCGGI